MSRKRVIVWEHIDESGIRILENSNRAETIYYDDKPILEDQFYSSLKEASAVMVRIKDFTREMIQRAPNLEIIAKHGVGYDQIDVAAATERKIPVTITPEANSDSVADHTMALMLSLSRNLLRADNDLKAGRFTRREHYTGLELGGKTIGIIGLGRIGGRVAKRCALGFDMKVLAYDPFISVKEARKRHGELIPELEPLLRSSDYVSIHAPLTELTENMIGEKELRSMKPEAILLNTARGGIVNETDLYGGLKHHWIRAAGLDVCVKEPPLPDENPLLELDNVIISPHIAGGAKEAAAKMATHAAEEILRVLDGKRPHHPINPEIYDQNMR
jgi:D-3-phosphoglycerate dehydrogenase